MINRKFYDSDVRSYPDLLDIAVDFVWDYPGDFEFLVAARELARLTDTLLLAVAGGVLNCMRADPAIASVLPTRPSLVAVPGPDHRHWSKGSTGPSLTHEPVKKLYRYCEMKVTVHAPYGVARMNGYKLHKVVAGFCFFRTYQNVGDKRTGWSNLAYSVFRVQWACQNRYRTNWPILLMEVPENPDWCQKCLERAAEL